jgi:hypothetical protein
MRKIKNYFLATVIVFAPALLLAHPGHEHHGTGMELIFHFLATIILALGLGAGLFYVIRYFLGKKDPVRNKHR